MAVGFFRKMWAMRAYGPSLSSAATWGGASTGHLNADVPVQTSK